MAKALNHPWEKKNVFLHQNIRGPLHFLTLLHMLPVLTMGEPVQRQRQRGNKRSPCRECAIPLSYLTDYYSYFLSVTFSVKLAGHFQGSPLLLSLWSHDTSTHSSARASALDCAHLHLCIPGRKAVTVP